ncbi:sensor histidine kinase [Coprobacillus cateniformis]|uniref:sensor histidine kinase n=1 Tax=Coprobacillus cateniformis TaxID=100884 RepID=UPI0026DF0813|nr:sensor histidine kinase [Coprobacillus cateniformis]
MRIYDLVIILENYFLVKILELCIPEIKVKQFTSILVTIILTAESFILSYFQVDEVLELVVPIITLVIYSNLFSRKTLINLFKIFAVFLNLTFIHTFVIMSSTVIIGDAFQSAYNNYSFMFILTCVSITILGIEYIFLKNHYKYTYQLSGYSILTSFLCSLVTFVMINVILKYYVLGMISYFLCIAIIFVFIFFLSLVVSLCVSNAKYYEKNLEQSLRLEAYDYEDKYIDAITERTVEYNKLRHDMKNHFDIVERMINTSHIQEAKDYMEQISFDQGEHYVHVNHLVLNYILSNKTKLAKSHGIDLCSVIIGKPVTFIADVDYSILVGNLLDNAIEATIEAKENEVNLCLSFYEDRFVIEVKNCVVDKPKSKQLLTNKKDKSKHGIGLKNIKDIVEKYNGQDVIEVNGNVFYHMCILYKVDEK